MNRLTLISGLMLFSLFFGAGKLIFPPMLGHQAGVDMWPAMAGFIVTGVLLPLLAVIVVAYFDEGVDHKACPSFEALKHAVGNYINKYNNERYQWGLKRMTPVQYRGHLLAA